MLLSALVVTSLAGGSGWGCQGMGVRGWGKSENKYNRNICLVTERVRKVGLLFSSNQLLERAITLNSEVRGLHVRHHGYFVRDSNFFVKGETESK